MLGLHPHRWSTLALFAILAPSPAPAQTVASSFGELRQLLRIGQTVFVTDADGQRTRGRVTDVRPSSLVIRTPDERTFADGTVTEIRVTDPLSNGLLIGAVAGAGFATWDYLIDPSEPGNAAFFAVGIGLGAAVGAGIDALVNRRGTLLYTSPPQTRRLNISTVLGRDRQAAVVSVRF